MTHTHLSLTLQAKNPCCFICTVASSNPTHTHTTPTHSTHSTHSSPALVIQIQRDLFSRTTIVCYSAKKVTELIRLR